MTTAAKPTRQLLRELVHGLEGRARAHVRAVKAEREEERETRRRAPKQFGIAIGLFLIGALLAAETIAAALIALGVPAWLGLLIVSVVLLGIAVVLLRR